MHSAKKRYLLLNAALAGGLLLPNATRGGATYTWAATSGNWTTTSNWTPNADPNNSADQVLFNETGTGVTLNNNRAIGSLIFNRDSNFSLSSLNTTTLTVSNGISVVPISGGASISIAASTLSFAGDNTFDVGSNATLNISALVDDSAAIRNLTKNGSGVLILSGANRFRGTTTINAGTLQVPTFSPSGSASPLGRDGALASQLVLNGGALRISGNSGGGNSSDRRFTIGLNGATIDASLNSTATVEFNRNDVLEFSGSGAHTLTLTGSNTSGNRFVPLINNDANNNATSLIKSGTGKWVLAPAVAHGYTGSTTINDGTLALVSSAINNPIAGSTKILVESSGNLDVTGVTNATNAAIKFRLATSQVLAGTGTVFGAVTTVSSGSKVMPGDTSTPGTLTLKDPFTLSSGTTLDIQSDANGFSILQVDATVNLQGNLQITANYRPPLNTPIVIVNKTTSSAISGSFANLLSGLIQASGGTYAGDYYSISNSGGTGNDVAMTRVAPEPSLLPLVGAWFLAARRRRSPRTI